MNPCRKPGPRSRVRFRGAGSLQGHQAWYARIAKYHDEMYSRDRPSKAGAFLDDLFRRRGPVLQALDVACGTFALDLALVRRGYSIIGRDLSGAMLTIAKHNLRAEGLHATIEQGDMRDSRQDGSWTPSSAWAPRLTISFLSGKLAAPSSAFVEA